MLKILSDPSNLVVLFILFAFLLDFVISSREVAIQLLLWRKGIAVQAQILKKWKIKIRSRNSSPYRIIYEFVEFSTGKTYTRKVSVGFRKFSQWKVGSPINVIILPHNPRISRLVNERIQLVSLTLNTAVLVFLLVHSFGFASLLVIFVICFVSFCGNLLWFGLRKK